LEWYVVYTVFQLAYPWFSDRFEEVGAKTSLLVRPIDQRFLLLFEEKEENHTNRVPHKLSFYKEAEYSQTTHNSRSGPRGFGGLPPRKKPIYGLLNSERVSDSIYIPGLI
jgi:hypothetical protein